MLFNGNTPKATKLGGEGIKARTWTWISVRDYKNGVMVFKMFD